MFAINQGSNRQLAHFRLRQTVKNVDASLQMMHLVGAGEERVSGRMMRLDGLDAQLANVRRTPVPRAKSA